MEEKPKGYYLAIHKSLTDPLLIGGLPRNLCLGLWSIGVALGVMLKMYWFFVPVIITHLAVRRLTKKDPDFFQTVVCHIHDRHYFDA